MTSARKIAAEVAFWVFLAVGAAAVTDIAPHLRGGTIIVPLPSVWWSAAVGLGCLATAALLGWRSPWSPRN